MTNLLFTKEEIESYGFIYEPDRDKCKSRKLRHYIPEKVSDWFKQEVVDEIKESGWKYIHQIKETENPYEGDPDFCCDSRVLVVGHL